MIGRSSLLGLIPELAMRRFVLEKTLRSYLLFLIGPSNLSVAVPTVANRARTRCPALMWLDRRRVFD